MRAFALLLGIATAEASACSCTPELRIDEQFALATQVASVRVESLADGVDEYTVVDEDGREVRGEDPAIAATVKVVEQFKGLPIQTLTLIARAHPSPCPLAPPMAVGDLYLVFVGPNGPSVYDFCTAPRILRDVPAEQLARWRDL